MRSLDVENVSRDGMRDRERGGVQAKPGRCSFSQQAEPAVEGVSVNRAAEALGMSAVHAQLVCAAGLRIEVDKSRLSAADDIP